MRIVTDFHIFYVTKLLELAPHLVVINGLAGWRVSKCDQKSALK